MELEPHHSVEVITVATTYNPNDASKTVVPLQIELEKFPTQKEIDGPDTKMRRPVRPIDRQRMRPWLMELLDCGDVFGLRWTSRAQGIFQISWKHASRLGWNLETDGDVFERWARHTGIYKEGDPPEPKRWKANFRCALHSLNDVIELTNAVERRGRLACRTYKFLQTGDDLIWSKKKAKQKKVRETRLIIPSRIVEAPNAVTTVTIESTSHEEVVSSEYEPEEVPQDKVIVEKVDTKDEILEEEYGLQHDHDYSVGFDKSGKTILLRQGVGSIVLQKEVVAAPEENSVKNLFISNLDQLASAAMSSAGLKAQGDATSGKQKGRQYKQRGKKKNAVEKVASLEGESTLKEYLLGNTWPEGSSEVIGSRSRKGSTTSVPTEMTEAIVSEEGEAARLKAYQGRKRKMLDPVPVRLVKNTAPKAPPVKPPSPPVTRQRKSASMSPKPAAKRTRKGRRGKEEEASESSEPLMSSCLLLLEAATRLDDAEKRSSAGTAQTDESSSGHDGDLLNDEEGDGKLEICDEVVVNEEEIDPSVDMCDSEVVINEEEVILEEVNEVHVEPEHFEIIVQSENPEEVPTVIQLEDSSADVILSDEASSTDQLEPSEPVQEESVTNISEVPEPPVTQSVISVLECKVMPESPVAKGLFSGSNIDSGIEQKTDVVKRVRTLPINPTVTWTDTKSSSAGSVIFVDNTVKSSASSNGTTGSTIDVESPTVQSNSGVQQTIIQRALPVLSAQVQKSGASSPVVIAHKVSGLAGTPQILMSPGTTSPSVLQSSSGKSEATSKNNSPLLRSELLSHLIKNKTLVPIKSLSPGTKITGPSVLTNKSATSLLTSVTASPTIGQSLRPASPAQSSAMGQVINKSPLLISQSRTGPGSRTIIFTRPPTVTQTNTTISTTAKKKDVLVCEPVKQADGNVKVHVIPVRKNTVPPQKAQVPPTIEVAQPKIVPTAPANASVSATIEDTEAGKSTPINIQAQVIFDPQRGPLLKLASGATLPLQSCIIQPPKVKIESQDISTIKTDPQGSLSGEGEPTESIIKTEPDSELTLEMITGLESESDNVGEVKTQVQTMDVKQSEAVIIETIADIHQAHFEETVSSSNVISKSTIATTIGTVSKLVEAKDKANSELVESSVLPVPLSTLFSQSSDSAVVTEEREDYDSRMMIDPRTPLSLGEVPLFAPSAAESDSGSPASDGAE